MEEDRYANESQMKRTVSRLLMLTGIGLIVAGAAWVVWSKSKGPESSGLRPEDGKHAAIPERHANQGDSLRRWRAISDDRLPWQRRVELVKEIQHPVSPELVDLLFAELNRMVPEENRKGQWIVHNEILNTMRDQGLAPDRFTKELVGIIRDPSLTVVQRDYAVQHLVQWISPAAGNAPGESDLARRELGLDTLMAAVTDPAVGQGTVAGTALHGIADLSNRIPQDQAEKIWIDLSPTVLKIIAGDIASGSGHQATAIQVAGMRRLDNCYPTIRAMAAEHATAKDPTLALSAIAALGEYRHPEDREFLTQVSQSNSRYRFAATEALRKLSVTP